MSAMGGRRGGREGVEWGDGRGGTGEKESAHGPVREERC